MAEKRRFSKRAYLSYFSRNASGGYVYAGGYYALQGGNYKGYAARLAVFTAVSALCVVAAGVIPAPGMDNCFYVLIPFIAEVGFAGSVLWGAVRFFFNAKPLREYIYTATAGAFHWRALLTAVFAGAGAIGETVYLILNGAGGHALAAAGLYLLKAAVILCMLLLRRFAKKSVWTLSAANEIR